MFDYDIKNLSKALKKVGIKKNDNLLVHSSLGLFGKLKGINKKKKLAQIFFKEIKKIIGKNGNIIVPTFTYSLFNNKTFIKNKSESNMGIFSEYVRLKKDSVRNNDPNFSISANGPFKKKFAKDNINFDTYSKDSFFAKFHELNGKILNLNFPGTTIIHFYEKEIGVNYRFDKSFFGKNENKIEKWTVFSKYLSKKYTHHNPYPITKLIKSKKIAKTSFLGKGEILCINSKDLFNTIKMEIKKNKWLLTKKNKKIY